MYQLGVDKCRPIFATCFDNATHYHKNNVCPLKIEADALRPSPYFSEKTKDKEMNKTELFFGNEPTSFQWKN